MTTPNAPTGVAAEHLKLTPISPNGEFKATWPGLLPNVAQRREYIITFLNWYHWHPNFYDEERALREHCEEFAAEKFILAGREPTSKLFEDTVDYLVWKTWFRDLPEEQRPKWPWSGIVPPRTEDDTPSAKFANLKEEWKEKNAVQPTAPVAQATPSEQGVAANQQNDAGNGTVAVSNATPDSRPRREDLINRLREISGECREHGIDVMWWETVNTPKSQSVGPAKKRLRQFVPKDFLQD
ncbi:uncharacterized protein B0J16DRAFT_315617 [Fusarium flagelliforme]|uniref:Uncharacterized protein n=1 Tax=Fusarium flagelliforme TaxID=2675880 RepID=A0A395N4P8_9HYPO|nr:uncharacterized protein B0J16DRAFT_315617 [Fusarium flagelliforme]KAH7191913.1 hypothetical protein B0J16DRAFT_315617 [Fusarium flagelliforme]RFN55108.1 hypothetical protein FIE12Z_620 [Fusarium flagelliforme]